MYSASQSESRFLAAASGRSGRSGIPWWKRVVDTLCIVLAAPVLLPVGVFIVLGIKLVSPGLVFFRQVRIGYRGSEFRIYKFRTMVANADTGVHRSHLKDLMQSNRPMVKLDQAGDSRLIPMGRWLRLLGLDELPQLINVLRGEMSLVGPRPCLPYEYAQYQPWHFGRLETLPGLTGLWQVNGKNRTTFEQMLDWDLQYVRERSPWLDFKIIFKTIPAIIVQVRDSKRKQRRALPPARRTLSPVKPSIEQRSAERTCRH